MSKMQAWSKSLRKFHKDEDGSVLMLFGLMAIMLFMFAGCGLDFARAQHAATKGRSALDSATLAAAKSMREDPSLTDTQLLKIAQDYFNANITRAGVGGTTWTPVKFIDSTPDRNTGTVRATAKGDVLTYFYRVAGAAYQHIPVQPTVSVTYNVVDVELGMMLDVTGSMSDDNKIGDLKSAMKTLADIMLPDSGPKHAKMALAPFSGSVNLGSYASVASAGRSKDGCVIERLSAGYRFTDVPPTSAAFGVQGDMATTAAYACPKAKLEPLTDDKAKLLASVNAYTPGGCTGGHMGAAWAWNLISPNWSGVWPTAPAPYNDGKTVKAVILMTDGLFNTAHTGAGSNCDNGNPLSGNLAKQTCDGMKAQGVSVYTVGFRLSSAGPGAAAVLAACASTPGQALLAEDGAQLKQVFTDIAIQHRTGRLEIGETSLLVAVSSPHRKEAVW